jgi:hypothetical protein
MVDFTALWDTGATGSVISQRVVQACQLRSIGTRKVNHVQGSTEDVPSYAVNVKLPSDVEFQDLRVILGNLRGYDVLIGMDIISLGDFAITHPDGNTKFSFRIPSQAAIDFAKANNHEKYRRGKRR